MAAASIQLEVVFEGTNFSEELRRDIRSLHIYIPEGPEFTCDVPLCRYDKSLFLLLKGEGTEKQTRVALDVSQLVETSIFVSIGGGKAHEISVPDHDPQEEKSILQMTVYSHDARCKYVTEEESDELRTQVARAQSILSRRHRDTFEKLRQDVVTALGEEHSTSVDALEALVSSKNEEMLCRLVDRFLASYEQPEVSEIEDDEYAGLVDTIQRLASKVAEGEVELTMFGGTLNILIDLISTAKLVQIYREHKNSSPYIKRLLENKLSVRSYKLIDEDTRAGVECSLS